MFKKFHRYFLKGRNQQGLINPQMHQNDCRIREIATQQKMLEILIMVGSNRLWQPLKNPDLYWRTTALKLLGELSLELIFKYSQLIFFAKKPRLEYLMFYFQECWSMAVLGVIF